MTPLVLLLALTSSGIAETVNDGRRLDANCENSATWRFDGRNRKDCVWVAAARKKRCLKVSDDGLVAIEACPKACGTCSTVNKIVVAVNALAASEEALAACQATTCSPTGTPSAHPTASPASFPPTSQPTRPPNPPLPQIMECLRNDTVTDYCGTCCPACIPIDDNSFGSYFPILSSGFPTWELQDDSKCVCLVSSQFRQAIRLSQENDCARLSMKYGDDIFPTLFGSGGDDALYMINSNFYGRIDGGAGNDNLAGVNTYRVYGGDGTDVCAGSYGVFCDIVTQD